MNSSIARYDHSWGDPDCQIPSRYHERIMLLFAYSSVSECSYHHSFGVRIQSIISVFHNWSQPTQCPIPCPTHIVASRIPTSATRNSPYFSCIPSSPWFFASPIAHISKVGIFGKIASKLSRKIIRPSVSFAFSGYSGNTFLQKTFKSVSEKRLLLNFTCFL
jgi:hypothetical protein